MAYFNASIADEWLQDDNLVLLESWARDGCTDAEISQKIGIAQSTLYTWKNKYPEIAQALKQGKDIVDAKVENALLKSALGYQQKEIKVTIGKQKKGGEWWDITKETTIKDVAPNVTAIAMWLNNRRPDKWKKNRDKVLELEDMDNNLQITIVRAGENPEAQENVNREIRVEKAPRNGADIVLDKKEDTLSANSKPHTAETEIEEDLDYWPEDWEEE